MSSAPQAEEAWSLFDFSPLFSGGLQSFLEQTLRTCGRWFAASGGSVFLQDSGGRFVLRAKTGAQTRIPEGSVIEPGEGLAGAAIRDGQARIVQGVQSSTDLASSMILPLAWGEKGVIGVMNLSRREGESRFDSGDLELAQALASQMAAAVANALLVDELERARQAADQARERLEAVLSSAPSHILHLDGQGELRLLAGGKEGGEEALARAQELAGQLAGFKEPAVRLLRDESGSKVWMARAQPLASGGAIFSIQDVTEHQRALEERSRMRRLAEIGQMTASIAHEIRNPLTGIRSAAQLLASSPEMSEEMAGIIRDEADRLEELCSDFLNYARPLSLNWEEAPLKEIGEQARRMVEAEAEARSVSLALRLEHGPPTILGDRARLQQVLLNLLRNGVQACQAGGKVELTADKTGLVVADNGSGMTAEQQDRLFSPFFTTKAAGTGLGLSSVKRIIEAHGWSISVQSAPGQGSEFRIDWREEAA
jgi:signal transduction histidine kinase